MPRNPTTGPNGCPNTRCDGRTVYEGPGLYPGGSWVWFRCEKCESAVGIPKEVFEEQVRLSREIADEIIAEEQASK